jgi:hypothetical protein
MGRNPHPSSGSPISIRLADDLRKDLSEAAKLLGLSEHDTMRIAMQVGLKHFGAIDHDLATAILASSPLKPAGFATLPPPSTEADGSNPAELAVEAAIAQVAGEIKKSSQPPLKPGKKSEKTG